MMEQDAARNTCPIITTPSTTNDGQLNFVFCMGSECQMWDDWEYKAEGIVFMQGQGDCGLKNRRTE